MPLNNLYFAFNEFEVAELLVEYISYFKFISKSQAEFSQKKPRKKTTAIFEVVESEQEVSREYFTSEEQPEAHEEEYPIGNDFLDIPKNTNLHNRSRNTSNNSQMGMLSREKGLGQEEEMEAEEDSESRDESDVSSGLSQSSLDSDYHFSDRIVKQVKIVCPRISQVSKLSTQYLYIY